MNADADDCLGVRLLDHGVDEPHDVLLHLFVALGSLDLREEVGEEGKTFLALTKALHGLEHKRDNGL